MTRDIRTHKFTKIIALLLIALFSTQQIAWAKVTDLKDDGSLGVDDVLISVITGYLAGKSIGANQSLIKTFVTTYGIPKVAGWIVDQLHIKNKILASAARMAISMAINAGLDAAGKAAAKATGGGSDTSSGSGSESGSASGGGAGGEGEAAANTGTGAGATSGPEGAGAATAGTAAAGAAASSGTAGAGANVGGSAAAAAGAEAPKGLARGISFGARLKSFFTGGFSKGAVSASKSGLWNSLSNAIGKAVQAAARAVVKGLWAGLKAPFTASFWNAIGKGVSAPFKGGFWSAFGKGASEAAKAPFTAGFWNTIGSSIVTALKAPFTSGFWKAVFAPFHALGRAVGRACKNFFTKNVLRAMWREGLKGAVYGAAKEAVYEALAKTSFGKKYKNTIDLIAQYSAMIVTKAAEIGIAKLDGNKVGKMQDGQLVYVEDKNAASWGKMGAFFRDQSLGVLPSIVQAYAADKDKAEVGILIGAGLTGLSNMLLKAADDESKAQEKRDAMINGKLTPEQQKDFNRIAVELPQEQRELDQLETELKEAKKQEDQERYNKLHEDYTLKKNEFEKKKNQYDGLYKTATEQMSDAERGMLGAFESEIAQARKSYERLLIESALSGGISYGLQWLSRKADNPVYGTIFNFMGSSLVKSLLIFSGYNIYRHTDGDELVHSSAGQASVYMIKPEKKTVGSFFSLFDNVLTEDYGNVFVDMATMGRGIAQFDKEGRSLGARLVNPYDTNFIARYNEYVQAGYKNFDLLGIVPVDYASSQQLLSSMHQQSIKNVQDSISDALYRVGLTSDSPLNKTYVYTHVKAYLNKAARKELRDAYDALTKELEGLKGQGLDDTKLDALIDRIREFNEKEGHWEAFWDYLGLAIGNSPYGAERVKGFIDDIGQLREALFARGEARTEKENALLAALDKYYHRFMQHEAAMQQSGIYGRLAVLRESYSDLTDAPVTAAERQQAASALMDNERIAVAAQEYAARASQEYAKESLFAEGRVSVISEDGQKNIEEAIYNFIDKEKPAGENGKVITRQDISQEDINNIAAYLRASYRDDYLNMALKGIDIYEDLNGNSRWVFGIGQLPETQRPAPAAQLPARSTLFVIQVGSGVGYVPPQAVLAELASRAAELIKSTGIQGPVDIRIIAQTDPRGPEALNQELVEKRKAALQALANTIAETAGLSQESVEVSSVLNREPVPGADPAVYEQQRRGQVAIAAQGVEAGEANVINLQAIPETGYAEFTPKKGDTVSGYAQQLQKEYYPNPDVPLDINKQVSRYLVESGQAEDAGKLTEGKTYLVPVENNENFTLTSDQTVIIISSSELDSRSRTELLKALYETVETRGVDKNKVYKINLGDRAVNEEIQAYLQLKGAKTELSSDIRGIQAVNADQVQINTRMERPNLQMPRPLITR
ncbi:MAG: hypothetical protein PHG31_04120 [Candidatus Omnitrophica bacterium]|nr:hypothetical protein [Candidatus Omnitrophota bacterium]